MGEHEMNCAALPLNGEENVFALVSGTREGMRALLGGAAEKLRRRIDPVEWVVKPEVQCLISDEASPVTVDAGEDAFPALAARLLYARWQAGGAGLALLPCADVPHNGEHLKEAVIAHAVEARYSSDFLRWLVTENRFCSTLSDCAELLIETDAPLPIPEAEGAVRYAADLTPYRLRRQRMLGGAGVLMAACACLCGVDTLGAAMREEELRALLGGMLTKEVIPALQLPREEGLRYAARVCAYLENACGQDRWPALGEGLCARFTACVLPAIVEYEKQKAVLPSCLCFALSALIMLYAGIRPGKEEGYCLPTEAGETPVLDRPYVLQAFSHMSCDMPPESLAYAALSDRELWGCDLREVEGLEDRVADQLRDMQLLGAREAARRAAAQ